MYSFERERNKKKRRKMSLDIYFIVTLDFIFILKSRKE